jgi:hypothetical protein
LGYVRFQQEDKDDSSVSLKSRIREAQREAAKRRKPDPRRDASNQAAFAGSRKAAEDETDQMPPTVEEIRLALLRKFSNGKNTL